MFNRFLTLLLFLVIVSGASPARADIYSEWGLETAKESIPQVWLDAFDANIEVIGENKDAFDKAFDRLDSDEKKKAGVFLVAFMPLVDLVAMDTETFVDNINFAFKARAEFSWGKDYDDDIFYHYVLPHRVTQEPIENFREFFYDKLKDQVKDKAGLEPAAIQVNKWCDEMVNFKQTQRRDQGPFETLKSGYGRCEEMMLFFVDACRSVGIPARQSWTPYWAHCDNNHAWAEVWANDRWNFIGGCEYSDALNKGWFMHTVKRVALVWSVPFGLPDKNSSREEIYRYADYLPDKYAIINSTSFYTTPGKLDVTFVDGDGNPAEDVQIYVYVFNFGILRPIARMKSDDGSAQLTIGEGTYFVSAGNSDIGGSKFVDVKKQKRVSITITPSDNPVADGYNWLHPGQND